jgi:4-hydroxy-tetrahydrodipicolinate reductase
MHSEGKLDSPSGTAISIAKAASLGKGKSFISPSSSKEVIPGTRGGELDGISIHSTRMQGRVAHHNLIFGGLGQTLTIQHDSISRESFMPGVILAVREVAKTPRLIVGLEKILGL